MNISSISKAIAIAAVATLTIAACSSKTQTPNDVQTRQDIMQDWRMSGDIMKGMIEKPETFDAKAFKEQADAIKTSTAHVWTHFANEADKGGSQDTVWTDAAGFKAKADEFNAAVDALATAAANAQTPADVEAAFGKMGETCGSCHKAYKQK